MRLINIVIVDSYYVRLILVCKMYVITVLIIVFAITVFSKSENRKTDTTGFIFGFGSFVNSHNKSVTTKSVKNHLIITISYLYTYEKIAEPTILLIVYQKIQMF